MNSRSTKLRALRVCVINQEPRILDKQLAIIENELSKLYVLNLVQISSIEDSKFKPCDLLIIIAHQLNDSAFQTWIKSFAKRMEKNNSIAVPCLIIGHKLDAVSRELLQYAVSENWYFDIVDVNHIGSLAIRSANLLRIHDHIHELSRYEKIVTKLEEDLRSMQNDLNRRDKK